MVIIDYYQKLSVKEKSDFIKQVQEATEMASSTFFYKIKNDSFTKLEREAIERIITDNEQCHDREN